MLLKVHLVVTLSLPNLKRVGEVSGIMLPLPVLFEQAGASVSDVYGDALDLNRSDSTFMNHRGAVYATDAILASKIRAILTV